MKPLFVLRQLSYDNMLYLHQNGFTYICASNAVEIHRKSWSLVRRCFHLILSDVVACGEHVENLYTRAHWINFFPSQEDGQEEVGRRSRRSRKEINYAELNDIQLPPLGRRDYVGNSDWSPPPVTKRRRIREEYIHEDYLVPRIRSSTRRFRRSPILEPETSKTETLEPVSGDEDSDNLTISPRVSTSGECLSTEALKKSSPPSPHQSDREHSDNSSTPNVVSSIKDFEKIGNAIDDAHPKLNFEPNGFTQNLQTLMTSQPDHAESGLFEGQGHTTITTKAVDTTSIYNVQCNDRHR